MDVAGAPPIEYNVPAPLTPVYWGDDVGLDSPPEVIALAKRTLEQIRVWPPHRPNLNAFIRPRLGIFVPGEAMGPEKLLLSYQSIHLFPAVPPNTEIVMENFAAQGGFRISATRTAEGETRDVRIVSALGGTCRMANPWPGRTVTVRDAGGEPVAGIGPDQTHVAFATRPGRSYEIHPQTPARST